MTRDPVGRSEGAPAPAVVASDLDGVAEIVGWLRTGRARATDPLHLVEVMRQVPLQSAVALRKDIEAWIRAGGRRPAAGA